MGYLVVCIIGDKSHVKRGITTWVLKRRWHMSMWVKDWLVTIAFAISLAIVRLHCEVAKTVSLRRLQSCNGGLFSCDRVDRRVFGITSQGDGANAYSCNNDRIEVCLLSP